MTNNNRLPRKETTAGQVLRLMLDGKARSKLEITDALGLHPAREVTARLRDYRKEPPVGYCLDIPQWTEQRDGQLVHVYQVNLDEVAGPLVNAMNRELTGSEVAA